MNNNHLNPSNYTAVKYEFAIEIRGTKPLPLSCMHCYDIEVDYLIVRYYTKGNKFLIRNGDSTG